MCDLKKKKKKKKVLYKIVKEALGNFSLNLIVFSKKVDIFIPLEGYTYACSFLTFNFNSVTEI